MSRTHHASRDSRRTERAARRQKAYNIEVHGRKHHYASFEDARTVADRIFVRTGVLVGIEATR
jgi:hypothetical protein